jgi:hypothetical protein
MAKTQFDPVDAVLVVASAIGLTSMAGIASWQLFDVTLGDTVFVLLGNDVTLATAVVAGSMLGTVITNDNAELSNLNNQIAQLDDYYMYAAVGGIGTVAAWVLFPGLESFVQSSDLWGVGYVALGVTSQFTLGWIL